MNVIEWFISLPQKIRTSVSKKNHRTAVSDLAWAMWASGYFARWTLDELIRPSFFLFISLTTLAIGYWWLGRLNKKTADERYQQLEDNHG